MTQSEKLLIKIARCDNYLKSDACKSIFNQQVLADRHLPEPWNGDIENSPILFISSNPFINENEYYPLESWKDEEITDFFKNRFSEHGKYVEDYKYPKLKNEDSELPRHLRPWVRYWVYVRSISQKLLNKNFINDVVPGKDYALMNVVRCKSETEKLVSKKTMKECCNNFFLDTLFLSNAKVIIVVGKKARDIISEELDIHFKLNRHIEIEIAGMDRLIIAIPHLNASTKKGLKGILPWSIRKMQIRLKDDEVRLVYTQPEI